MNQHSPPPSLNLIPETAPFSAEQRAWLNGFFAGLVSLDAARRHRAVAGAGRRADAGRWPAMATTAKRPGTTRPCRSTNA